MIQFTVFGKAAAAGSKRGFYRGGKVIVTDANKNSRPWKAQVADAAAQAMAEAGIEMFRDPLYARFQFYVPRPRSHYGSGKNSDVVLPSARPFPSGPPDLLKLARGCEDACSGIVYADDSLIVIEQLEKFYGEPARVEVTVYTLASQNDT